MLKRKLKKKKTSFQDLNKKDTIPADYDKMIVPKSAPYRRKKKNIKDTPTSEPSTDQNPVADEILDTNPQEKKKREAKLHVCVYCLEAKANKVTHTDLKKHMKRRHLNLTEIKDMKNDSILNPGSREPMKKLLYKGDYLVHNKKEYNQGVMHSARKPCSDNVTAADMVVCGNCYGTFVNTSYADHVKRYLGLKKKEVKIINKRVEV